MNIIASLLRRPLLTLPAALILMSPIVGSAQVVTPFGVDHGWDLFHTLAGTSFLGVPIEGVPIGIASLPGDGTHYFGNADTIVERLTGTGSMNAGDTRTVSLKMEYLQLKTIAPTNFGLGIPVDTYYVTLQTGHESLGSMNITVDPTATQTTGSFGTFTSSIDLWFDVHEGSLTGNIVYESEKTIKGGGEWSHLPGAQSLLFPGVNYLLNGVNDTNDFHIKNWVSESDADGAVFHVVEEAAVPEPSTYGLSAAAFLAIAGVIRRRRRTG